MKKKIYKTLLIASLMSFPFVTLAGTEPGNPPIGPGTGDVPIGGGAPIGGGSIILLGLAAAYGRRKIYLLKKESLEE